MPRVMVRGRRSRSFGMACCALGVVLGAGPCPHDRAYIRARSGLRLCTRGRGGADTNACRSRNGLRHGGCATRREGDGDEEAEGGGFHEGFLCWLDFVTAGQSGCPPVGACFTAGKRRLCGAMVSLFFEPRRRRPVRDGRPTRLLQILAKIFVNACKYTEPGGRVSVGVTYSARRAEVQIADTGIGLDAEMMPTIFELFTQAPVRSSRPKAASASD